jgi:hypothetical protein
MPVSTWQPMSSATTLPVVNAQPVPGGSGSSSAWARSLR